MSKHFLESAYEKDKAESKWIWQEYAFNILLVCGFWLFLAYYSVESAAAVLKGLGVGAATRQMISDAVPFALIIGWLAIALPLMHKRPLLTLVNAESKLNFKRVGQGFGVWFLMMSVWLGVSLWTEPEQFQFTFDPVAWSALFGWAIILVPIQTSAEELFFRGYVLQGLRLITRNRLAMLITIGLLFSIPHWGNPEMERGAFIWGALNYFAWGVFATAIALKDNGLELSLGVHAANNLFLYLFLSTPDSVVVTQSMFMTYADDVDPRLSLFGTLLDAAIFYAIFFGGISRPTHDAIAKSTTAKQQTLSE